MGVRLQADGAQPFDQLAERRIAAEVGAQGDRVDEAADQRLELRPGAHRDRRADQQVVAPAEAREHRRPGRRQHHERRRALAARGAVQRGAVDREVQVYAIAARGGDRRPRPVERQVERLGFIGEPRRPVAALPLKVPHGEPAPLPDRRVGDLDRQRRKRGLHTLAERSVRRTDLVGQQAERPAVGDEVVKGEDQLVLRQPEREMERAQQRRARQVEGAARLERRDASGLGAPEGGRQCRQVDPREGELRPLRDLLHRAVEPLDQAGAQHFVPLYDPAQRRRERRHVELAPQRQPARQVIGRRTRLEPVEEPDPLLREGRGEQPAPRDALKRQRGGRRLGAGRRRIRRDQRAQALGQPGDGRRLEQCPRRQLDAERPADPRQQPHRGERVPAERRRSRRRGRRSRPPAPPRTARRAAPRPAPPAGRPTARGGAPGSAARAGRSGRPCRWGVRGSAGSATNAPGTM